MPHTKARRFKPQARLEPAQYHWWQAWKADVLTVTPRVVLSSWERHSKLTDEMYIPLRPTPREDTLRP